MHPNVGDTIDLVEKIDYLLFPEIPDSLYDYVIVYQEEENYTFKYAYNSNYETIELSPVVVENYKNNIDKLSRYYDSKLEMDSVEFKANSPLVRKDSIPTGLDIDWMSEQQKKKMINESSRYNRLKLEADEMGLMGFDREKYIKTGGYLELF